MAEPDKMELTVTKVPKVLGSTGRVGFTSEDSVEERSNKSSGLGRKAVQERISFIL